MKQLKSGENQDRYTLSRKICKECPRAKECLKGYEKESRGKRFLVPHHHELFAEVLEKQKNPEFKKKMWERMWKIEGIFAEAKSHHGMGRLDVEVEKRCKCRFT